MTDKNRPIKNEYRDTIEGIYNADILPVDFADPKNAYDTINDWAAKQTEGELTKVVKPNDVLMVKPKF